MIPRRMPVWTFAALALSPVPAAAQPPVSAFGDLPAIEAPALSPDGAHYAIVQAHQGKPIISVFDANAPGAAPYKMGAGDGRIATMVWASNDHLIVILKANMRVPGDSQVRTWWRSIAVDVRRKTAAIMMSNVGAMRYNLGVASIADLTLSDPDHVFMPLWSNNLNLYKVNVNDGRAELSHSGIMWTVGWIMDGNGKVVARVDAYPDELKIHVKVPAGRDWREIAVFDMTAGGSTHVAGITEDGAALVLDAPTDTRRVGVFRVDFGTLQRTQLYAHPEYDVAGLLRDEWTQRVIGAVYIADRPQYVFFDAPRQKLQSALEAMFAGRTVALVSCDVPRTKCIFSTRGPRHPPDYHLLEVATMRTAPLGSAYPGLTQADLGEMRPYSYAARDGLRIPGYLTLPPGKEARNLPLVVMPHGGPDLRDYLTFDWWAQFLANRGYAVLQPNFRGSSGYGLDFTAQGFRQWGLKMQDDLADGVARLVADGIADPKRVCIVGASYGGYAALAGAAFNSGTYACAVSFAGLGDLDEMLRVEERDAGRESVAVTFWEKRIGSRHGRDSAQLAATSPARHAGNIQIPVLLMHATGDTTVPIAQSRAMRDAMRRANKPVEYVELDGDDHYLDLAATRTRVLGEIEKFLAVHIGR